MLLVKDYVITERRTMAKEDSYDASFPVALSKPRSEIKEISSVKRVPVT